LETVVEDVSTAAQVASYPVPLEDIITHPSGNVWAGALNHHMVIFLLEELGMNNAPDGIESSKAYVDLAKDLQTRGEIEGAKRAFESAIRAAEPLLNERQRDTELTHAVQWLYETVGAILWEQGKESEALQYFEKALALADSMVDESQPTAEMKWNLARVLYIVGTLRSEVMGIAAAQSALIRCHQTLLIMRAMDVPLPTEAEELLKSMGALADRLRASGMSVEVYGQ
jgi:tetratricopeptide (TPR) repeat protein